MSMPAAALVLPWLKKHWQWILFVVVIVIGILLFRQREMSFVEDYRKLKDVHAVELRKIEEARQIERKLLEENQRKLQERLSEIQKRYDEREKEFDTKKKTEVAKIVREHGDRPDELARQLADAAGFKIVMPGN